MKNLMIPALLLTLTLSAFASYGDPSPAGRVLNLGTSAVTVVFDNSARDFDLTDKQLETIVARVEGTTGKHYFIITSEHSRAIQCGYAISEKKSISVNLPPQAILVAATNTRDGLGSTVRVAGVKNTSAAWTNYSGILPMTSPSNTEGLPPIAQSKGVSR
ncbi:MAG: hypothetical protein HY962_15380 [Ignavibacteriae bacterium]|nr:hypothetical protein [Ignavibacteriota bacterium]